jgi:hypothetical protein
MVLFMTLISAISTAQAAPRPSPSAAQGGCEQGGLASISNRPGVGRAVTVNGSPCVVPVGDVVIEGGYRNQVTTASGTSWLTTYPNPIVRFGIAGFNEVVFSPPLAYSFRSGADLGGTFIPAAEIQDFVVCAYAAASLRRRPTSSAGCSSLLSANCARPRITSAALTSAWLR